MTFGGQCDEEESGAILDRALEAGISFIDTADVYPMTTGEDARGRTEEIIGRWMRGRRDDVVLATKCGNRMGPQPWDRGSSRKHVVAALEDSLRRLGTDHIDLYQLHLPDRHTPIDETLAALDDVVRAGKVRYIGCSNFAAYQVARALGRSELHRLARFVSVQPRYSLLFRSPEVELFPLCEEEQVAVIPYNPLAGGLLTGKHGTDAPEPGSRFDLGGTGEVYRNRYFQPREHETVAEVVGLAREAGIAPAQMALGWVLAQPAVTAPIVGASRPEQLDAALAAVDAPLPEDLRARLDEVTVGYRGAEMRP
jgi:aryl-alcohol dehydrogenase (NADP+)